MPLVGNGILPTFKDPGQDIISINQTLNHQTSTHRPHHRGQHGQQRPRRQRKPSDLAGSIHRPATESRSRERAGRSGAGAPSRRPQCPCREGMPLCSTPRRLRSRESSPECHSCLVSPRHRPARWLTLLGFQHCSTRSRQVGQGELTRADAGVGRRRIQGLVGEPPRQCRIAAITCRRRILFDATSSIRAVQANVKMRIMSPPWSNLAKPFGVVLVRGLAEATLDRRIHEDAGDRRVPCRGLEDLRMRVGPARIHLEDGSPQPPRAIRSSPCRPRSDSGGAEHAARYRRRVRSGAIGDRSPSAHPEAG